MASKNIGFTERLKIAISGTELDNHAFCEKSELGYSTLMNYLNKNNIGKVPEWDQLVKISKASKKSIDWLLTGTETGISCILPPGSDEFCNRLRDILQQTSDEQVKNALRTNLVAFKNSIDKDKKTEEKDKRIDVLEKKVDYLTELYDRKIKSDT